jgi:endonuclease III
VIFDQGIAFQRAWAAPYELRKRLGHLDPARIAAEPEQVAEAIRQAPSLHRFVNNLSRWVVAAARRVMEQYGGRADTIWEGSPTASELQRRLDEFDGIAQKKAAMAVEILERVRKVSITQMHGSDVAYDRHIRRVFLRTGLALYDDADHIIAVARQLNAERPGAIDFPAWRVGVDWCHPGVPDCPNCRLREPCPKLVDRAVSVRGG